MIKRLLVGGRIVLLLLLVIVVSCKSRPTRKKLPDFMNLSGFEATMPATSEQEPFYASDTTMYASGSSKASFLLITFSSASYDSLAASLIDAYRPMAATLFRELVRQGKRGVVLDLRSTAGNVHRTDFAVKLTAEDNSLSLSVVFLWNDDGGRRAAHFMADLQSLLTLKSSSNGTEQIITASDHYGRQDCFSGTAAAINE